MTAGITSSRSEGNETKNTGHLEHYKVFRPLTVGDQRAESGSAVGFHHASDRALPAERCGVAGPRIGLKKTAVPGLKCVKSTI